MAEDDLSGRPTAVDGAVIAGVRALGYAGLAPFVILSLWLYAIKVDHPWRAGTILLLLVYGAVILSFLGGSRWGLLLARLDTARSQGFALATLPAILGWLAVVIPVPYAFAILAVAFAAHGAWDSFAVNDGAVPDWYGRLRMTLTLCVVLTMIVAFAATG